MVSGYLQVTIYMSEVFNLQLLSMMVGKFAGWLLYFPALPNCESMFQNSTGGSSTMSLTFHGLVSQKPDFQYVGNVCHAQYEKSYIQVSI